jgi:hypothetical protein
LIGFGLPGVLLVVLGALLFDASRGAADVEAARPPLQEARGVVTESGSHEKAWTDRNVERRVKQERRASLGDKEARRERERELDRGVEIVHYVWLRYTFDIDGHTYQGDRYAFSGPPSFPTKAAAQVFLAKHQPGATVTVYYDPSDRAHCALVPSAPGSGLGGSQSGPLSFAVLTLVLGVVLCGLGVRSLRPPTLPPPPPDPDEVAAQAREAVLGPTLAGTRVSPDDAASTDRGTRAAAPPLRGVQDSRAVEPAADRTKLALVCSAGALLLGFGYHFAVARPARLRQEAAVAAAAAAATALVDAVRADDAERVSNSLVPGAFDPDGEATAPGWTEGIRAATSVEVGPVSLDSTGTSARVKLRLDLGGSRYPVELELDRSDLGWRVVGKAPAD